MSDQVSIGRERTLDVCFTVISDISIGLGAHAVDRAIDPAEPGQYPLFDLGEMLKMSCQNVSYDRRVAIVTKTENPIALVLGESLRIETIPMSNLYRLPPLVKAVWAWSAICGWIRRGQSISYVIDLDSLTVLVQAKHRGVMHEVASGENVPLNKRV